MEHLSLKARFARDFVDLKEATQLVDASWEEFQINFLQDTGKFSITLKSRQVAWSFTAALDAVIDAIVNPGTPHPFVSINKEEAGEKIRYARAILQSVHPDVRPRLTRDSQTELEFSNGSRLISHPCKPVRGLARARVYLDEMAHYPVGLDRQIYLAALPATTRGDGYIRIGSSPMGATGLFWEIYVESLRKWPGFRRFKVPWWEVKALCKDVPTAKVEAPSLTTGERVEKFGTPALLSIFENMFLEDFQQEYEMFWSDDSVSWVSWELIQKCQDTSLHYYKATSVDEAIALIPLIQDDISNGKIEPVFSGGVDIGRVRDLTEFVALGKSSVSRLPIRVLISLSQIPLDDQQYCFETFINNLPFIEVQVDKTGIGTQLAEHLELATFKAKGVSFTQTWKEAGAVETRSQMEQGNIILPLDRELAYQIHSVKKKVTPSKNLIFDTDRNEKHHADKFWALVLAAMASRSELYEGFVTRYI